MKPKHLLIFCSIALLAAVFVIVSHSKREHSLGARESYRNAKLFHMSLRELGLAGDVYDGSSSFSAGGTYLVFGTVSENGEEQHEYLYNFANDSATLLPGGFVAWGGEKVLALAADHALLLYDIEAGTSRRIEYSSLAIRRGVFSPDLSKLMLVTDKGLRLVDVAKGTMTSVSSKPYDGAFAWFSDNQYILGFRQNDIDNLYEAGVGRLLAVWNTDTKHSEDLYHIDLPSSALQFVEWVVPDHVARVHAGFDDGSFDYMVNLDREFVTDLGETSGIMNGVSVNKNEEHVAVLSTPVVDAGTVSSYARIYDKEGTVVCEASFSDGMHRQHVSLVGSDTLAYIREGGDGEGGIVSSLVSFDCNDTKERVIEDLGNARVFGTLTAPDSDTIIVPLATTFVAVPL